MSSAPPHTTPPPPVRRVGLLGSGPLCAEIIHLLSRLDADRLAAACAPRSSGLEIAAVCVNRDGVGGTPDFAVPPGCRVCTSYESVLEDPAVDVVVEATSSSNYVVAGLRAGKDVVAAMPSVASRLTQVERALAASQAGREGRRPLAFRYGGSACGGAPIVRQLLDAYRADDVTEVTGVVDPAAAAVLAAMAADAGLSHDEAREAERERTEDADPHAEETLGARSTLRILMRLAFGADASVRDIAAADTSGVTQHDFEYARMLGGTIVPVGRAAVDTDGRVAAYVGPAFVAAQDRLAHTGTGEVCVEIVAANAGTAALTGRGEGILSQANAVLSDLIAIAQGNSTHPHPFGVAQPGAQFVPEYAAQFYLRMDYSDTFGIVRQVGEICERCGVNIHSLLQNPIRAGELATFVIVTDKVTSGEVQRAASMLEALDWCRGGVFVMPVLREGAIK